jgi:hypothetical protein
MVQAETATRRDTASGALPPVFFSNGQIAEVLPGGAATATLDDAEAPAIVLFSETLKWSELAYNGQTFVLNKELTIQVTQEEGGWSFESEAYGLLGFGHTRSEAELSFCFDFAVCWRECACEDDSKLALKARELKQDLLGLVSSQR